MKDELNLEIARLESELDNAVTSQNKIVYDFESTVATKNLEIKKLTDEMAIKQFELQAQIDSLT